MIVFSSISPKNWTLYDEFIIYNLSSLFEGYDRINILPIGNINNYSGIDFDISYYNMIYNNDIIFKEFMEKIILPLYNNDNIMILVSKDDIFDNITESLSKLLQSRYNIISTIINDTDDINNISDFNDFKSLEALSNLDEDKFRYMNMV